MNKRDLCKTSSETFPEIEKHLENTHDLKEPVERLDKLERHVKTNYYDIEDHNNLHSDSKEVLKKHPCMDTSNEDIIDDSFPVSEYSTKHLCHICLLSFSVEDELKQHAEKHTKETKPRSILKR